MSENRVLGRDDLLKSPEPEVHKVYCEALDGYVYMKVMSALDQDSYEWSLMQIVDKEDGTTEIKRNMDAMRLKYLVRVMCNEKGKRLFQDHEYNLLGSKSRQVVQELHTKALEINGASPRQVEQAEKNSGTELTGDSNSG